MITFPVALKDIQIHLTRNTFTDPEDNFELTIIGTGEVMIGPHGYSRWNNDQPLHVSSEIVREMIAEAMEIGFFEMNSEYSRASELYITPEGTLDQGFGDILDGTQINISIEIGSEKHSIYAHWGYPKRLDALIENIIRVSGVGEWLHID